MRWFKGRHEGKHPEESELMHGLPGYLGDPRLLPSIGPIAYALQWQEVVREHHELVPFPLKPMPEVAPRVGVPSTIGTLWTWALCAHLYMTGQQVPVVPKDRSYAPFADIEPSAGRAAEAVTRLLKAASLENFPKVHLPSLLARARQIHATAESLPQWHADLLALIFWLVYTVPASHDAFSPDTVEPVQLWLELLFWDYCNVNLEFPRNDPRRDAFARQIDRYTKAFYSEVSIVPREHASDSMFTDRFWHVAADFFSRYGVVVPPDLQGATKLPAEDLALQLALTYTLAHWFVSICGIFKDTQVTGL